MLFIYLIINFILFYLYLNFLNQKTNIKKIYKEYVESIKSISKTKDNSELINKFDRLTIKGSKLFLIISLYLMPSIPSFYYLTFLKISPFISIIFISISYLLLLFKYRNE